MASFGMALSGLGPLLLAFLLGNASLGFIIGSLAVLGFGFALFSFLNTDAMMSSVEKNSTELERRRCQRCGWSDR